MTGQNEDHFLRDILLEAANQEFNQELFDDSQVNTSPQFIRQMRNMLKNPSKWSKHQKRPYRKKAMQTAATLILICALSFGVLLTCNSTVRAAVIRWVTEWYETGVIYRFFGESVSDKMPLYEISDLPLGYVKTEAITEIPDNIEITYKNEIGDIIRFGYIRVEEGSAVVVDTENMEITDITINGCPGQLYVSTDPQQSNCIMWYDEKAEIQFMMDGFFDGDKLQMMASSIFLVT